MNQPLNDIRSKLEAQDVRRPAAFSIELFNKRGNKTTLLVENADPQKFLDGQNREYRLELKGPVYVQRIVVHVADYIDGKSAEFSWRGVRNPELVKSSRKVANDSFSVVVNDIIESFAFKPEKQYFKDPKISRISVYGLTAAQLDQALAQLGSIDAFLERARGICADNEAQSADALQKLEETNLRIEELGSQIAELEGEKRSLDAAIVSLKSTRAEVSESIAQKAAEEGELKSRIVQLDDSIDEKTKQAQSLNQEIVDRNRHLTKLKNDINLFPTEISGFVSQGARNIMRYTLLSLIPIGVLFYITWYLFHGAADFARIYSSAPPDGAWTVLLYRLPFVAVCLGIISACYKIAAMFIVEIIRINSQRLNLSKISIIAKDVSDASEIGIDLPEEQRVELRTRFKMDLLRSHLRGYIETGYAYRVERKDASPTNGTESPSD